MRSQNSHPNERDHANNRSSFNKPKYQTINQNPQSQPHANPQGQYPNYPAQAPNQHFYADHQSDSGYNQQARYDYDQANRDLAPGYAYQKNPVAPNQINNQNFKKSIKDLYRRKQKPGEFSYLLSLANLTVYDEEEFKIMNRIS